MIPALKRPVRTSVIVTRHFRSGQDLALAASVTVSYWNGLTWVPVTGQHVSYATASDQPTTIAFDPMGTTAERLDMTSRSPHDPTMGNLTIAEITIPGDEVAPAQ